MNKQEFEKQLAIKTNLLYCLTDVLESQLMDVEADLRKIGSALRFESKRNYNTAIRGIRGIKFDVAGISMQSQIEFGDEADMLAALLLTLFDRCGTSPMLLYRFYEYIRSFPSTLHMNMESYENAFDILFNKPAKTETT